MKEHIMKLSPHCGVKKSWDSETGLNQRLFKAKQNSKQEVHNAEIRPPWIMQYLEKNVGGSLAGVRTENVMLLLSQGVARWFLTKCMECLFRKKWTKITSNSSLQVVGADSLSAQQQRGIFHHTLLYQIAECQDLLQGSTSMNLFANYILLIIDLSRKPT